MPVGLPYDAAYHVMHSAQLELAALLHDGDLRPIAAPMYWAREMGANRFSRPGVNPKKLSRKAKRQLQLSSPEIYIEGFLAGDKRFRDKAKLGIHHLIDAAIRLGRVDSATGIALETTFIAKTKEPRPVVIQGVEITVFPSPESQRDPFPDDWITISNIPRDKYRPFRYIAHGDV